MDACLTQMDRLSWDEWIFLVSKMDVFRCEMKGHNVVKKMDVAGVKCLSYRRVGCSTTYVLFSPLERLYHPCGGMYYSQDIYNIICRYH